VTQTIARLIRILVAAATPMSANPSCATSSAGGSDTLRSRPEGRAAGIPVVIPEMESAPSSPASSEWLTDPRFRPQGVSLLARRRTDLPFGVSWTQWDEHGRPKSCEPFQGHQYSIPLEDYWVYRCTEALAGGTLEYFTYLLDEGHEPTLERARWSLNRSELRVEEVRAIYDTVVDTLTHVLGPPTPNENSGSGHVSWIAKWDFTRVSTSAQTFAIELRSSGLRSTLDKNERIYEESEEVQDTQALRRDVIEALRARWPDLARAVGTTPSAITDAPKWREALTRFPTGATHGECGS
jgi:hypothetical protein